MEQLLICMSLSLIAGLLASRVAKAVRLPAVTSYLVAGLLLGPFFLGRLGLSGWGFGFGSLAQVESYGIITQVALGFIAFVIGNEFRLSALESMGRQAVTVGILQAVITTVLVDIALVALHFARPDVISMASAITLGAIASATAPAATLMVVKQYKANGPLTRLLLMVVAIDDAVGLVLFSASFGIANALEQGRIDPISILLEPLVEIVLSLGLGALAGLLLNQLEIYFHSRSKRMSLSVAFVLLAVGLSMVSFEVGPIHCSFSLLLVCMMTGTVFLVPSILLPALWARSPAPMSAARPPAAARRSRSIWASPCCRRPVWRWAWPPRLPSFPMATWCATWCSSRCWCTSWSARPWPSSA